jgi:hypothetical protein
MTDRRRVTITSLIPRVEAIRQQDCQGIVGRLRRDLGLESTSHGQHPRPADLLHVATFEILQLQHSVCHYEYNFSSTWFNPAD